MKIKVFKVSNRWTTKTKKLFAQTLRFQSKQTTKTNNNFRLLIITQFYPPDYAATGQLIQELAVQLGKENIQVSIFTGQPGYAFQQPQAPALEREKGISIRRSQSYKLWSTRIRGKTFSGILFSIRAGLYLLRHGRKYNTVLLTTAPPFLSVVGYVANLLFKINYVCLIYDLYPDAAIELGVITANHPLTKLWHQVNQLVWQNSQKIIVLTETMKQRILARHPQIAPQISVIHNWANEAWIKPLAKQQNWFAHIHGIDNQFTVLYSGNFGRCHDLDTIIKAMELLQNLPVKFVFIGAGAKYDLCRQLVSDRHLHNCTFLPYQDRKNLPYSLTACDLALVSIAPGLEGVVAPSKLYGIMAAGKAIAAICEPHSYLRQLIQDANCGQCFDNYNSVGLAEFILRLMSEPNLAATMGKAGRKYMVANFTPKIIAQQYRAILNQVDTAEDRHLLNNIDSSVPNSLP